MVMSLKRKLRFTIYSFPRSLHKIILFILIGIANLVTDPCCHMDVPVYYAVSEMCASCFQSETGPSWIFCPLCSQWCHDECYDNFVLSVFIYDKL